MAVSGAQVVVTGRVSAIGGAPLGYAVVAVKETSREVFANNEGSYTIAKLPRGRLSITAKRIGYSPVDTTIETGRSDTIRVDIQLPIVSIQLPAVHSMAKACVHPGTETKTFGLELATLFEQLRQNAERNRLLARDYPFEIEVERRISRPEPALEARFVAFDTVLRSSARNWSYAPGHMLGTREFDSGVFVGRWTTLVLPELADYAEARFLDAHCFDYGGVEMANGDSLLRIDFSPAPNLRAPDVVGSILLDRKTYQLRTTLTSLVNMTREMRRQISGQSVRADFKEVVPGVPVLDRISSVVYPLDDPKGPATEPSTEIQRALRVRFIRGRP
jgi:hypothetical protein